MFEGNFQVGQVDDMNFRSEILEASGPVLVGISASWCHPGKAMDPLLERLAMELGRNLKVVSMDADRCGRMMKDFGVDGVPTFLFLQEGKEAGRIAGIQPYDLFKERVEQLLN